MSGLEFLFDLTKNLDWVSGASAILNMQVEYGNHLYTLARVDDGDWTVVKSERWR